MLNQTKLAIVSNSSIADIDPESFYQTPSLMALKAIRAKLTAADWALWSYLQIIDPYGDRMVELPKVSEIAEVIAISERQVKRSLAKLEQLELYHWESVATQGQNLAGKKAREFCNQKRQLKKSVQIKMTDLSSQGQNRPTNDKIVTPRTDLSSHGQICPNQEPEPSPDKLSSSSQTIHTYSDFKKTLSDSERETFESFVRNEWRNQKSEEILSIERFLSKPEDLKNWYDAFLKSSAGSAAKQKALTLENDWANHPRRDEWLEEIRQGRPRFIALGDRERNA